MSSIKNLLLVSFLAPAISHATTIGIGEYRFGPDTPENFACKIAEEDAKTDSIKNFLGEILDSSLLESCKNTSCFFQKDTISEINGVIKKLDVIERKIVEELGHKKCIVTIESEVEKIVNNIKFNIFQDNFSLVENEDVKFEGISNSSGKIMVFNYFNDVYTKIYEQDVSKKNEKFVIPSSNYKLTAKLPYDKIESKEMLMFLFVEKDVQSQQEYSQKEMREFLSSLPFEKFRVVNRHFNIMRSL